MTQGNILSDELGSKSTSEHSDSSIEEDSTRHKLVRLLEEKKWDDFGFFLFRTDYSDDERFEAFFEKFNDLLEDGFKHKAQGLGDAIDMIDDKLLIKKAEDEQLDDCGILAFAVGKAAGGFLMFQEENDVEPGLDTKMVLMANAECVASVLEPKSWLKPFVYAVDVKLSPDGGELGGDEDYSGFFKVAIKELVPGFYMALQECDDPSEVQQLAEFPWRDPEAVLAEILDE